LSAGHSIRDCGFTAYRLSIQNPMECFMRRIIQLSVACLAAGVVSACSNPEQVQNNPDIPTGGVRFINAVPDTAGSGGIDFRFVDIVENNAHYAIGFRNNIVTTGGVPASTQIEFKATQAGSRHFRIFLDDTLTTVASTVLKDSTITVEANHRYTVLLWGNARGGATPMKLTVIDETYDPGSQVGLRVINTTSSPIDARYYTSTSTAPTAASWASIPAMTVSNYLNVAPAQYKFNITGAGSTTALFADATALVGQANGTVANGCTVGVDCDAIPGTTAAGSAVTAIVFPRSVAGSKAPQSSAYGVPAITFMWDKRPPRVSGT
jgi:hypothetical protein